MFTVYTLYYLYYVFVWFVVHFCVCPVHGNELFANVSSSSNVAVDIIVEANALIYISSSLVNYELRCTCSPWRRMTYNPFTSNYYYSNYCIIMYYLLWLFIPTSLILYCSCWVILVWLLLPVSFVAEPLHADDWSKKEGPWEEDKEVDTFAVIYIVCYVHGVFVLVCNCVCAADSMARFVIELSFLQL